MLRSQDESAQGLFAQPVAGLHVVHGAAAVDGKITMRSVKQKTAERGSFDIHV